MLPAGNAGMRRRPVRSHRFRILALALTLTVPGLTTAHHPPKMERCESFAFTGEIERIVWQRPHVELFIRTADGTTHHLTWLAINQLSLEGIEQDTLAIGDQVIVIAGIQRDEVVERPLLLSYVHRDSDGWGWAQTPQGC
jgi:hypothetical protein